MSRPINIARASDVLGKPKPIAPAILVDARQETLHKESGKVVRTKVIRKGAGSGMNKTEERFKREVIDQMENVLFDCFGSIKLRLADRTWYTPDFVVWMANGADCIFEVKGSWKAPHQEDSRVKLKVAAEAYPQFQFFAAVPNRETGGWDIEEIP
jgi:hypothetical protein